MTGVQITVKNIENYRGVLTIRVGDLPTNIWSIFDRAVFEGRPNACIVSLRKIISRKNELLDPKFIAGEKPDPRQTAFDHMLRAVHGPGPKRAPVTVQRNPNGTFAILDGNATSQALMLAGWTEIPVLVENP